MQVIYTIGYTAFKIEEFIQILKRYNISCIIDVRSTPFSQFYPDYNKNILENTLKTVKIYYRNYVEEFGARQTNRNYLTKEGYLDFKEFVKSESFKKGVEKIKNGMVQGYTFALMCAEKDPINCHRNIMIASELYRLGYEIKNIMEDGNIQTQNDIEMRLLEIYFPNRKQLSLFEDNSNETELISEAYKKRNAEIGYKTEEE